jgi:hypothetical protein
MSDEQLFLDIAFFEDHMAAIDAAAARAVMEAVKRNVTNLITEAPNQLALFKEKVDGAGESSFSLLFAIFAFVVFAVILNSPPRRRGGRANVIARNSMLVQPSIGKDSSKLPQMTTDNDVKKMTLDRMNQAPKEDIEPQTKLSQSDIEKSKDVYLKPLRTIGSREKFNEKYDSISIEQKQILKEFINSVDSAPHLREFYNTKIAELKEHLSKSIKTIQDPATKVKVEEIAKHLVELDKTAKVNDDHLVDLMQYYELVQEIKKANGVQI